MGEFSLDRSTSARPVSQEPECVDTGLQPSDVDAEVHVEKKTTRLLSYILDGDQDEASLVKHGPPKIVLETWTASQLRPVLVLPMVTSIIALIILIVDVIVVHFTQEISVEFTTGPNPETDVESVTLLLLTSDNLVYIDIAFKSFMMVVALLFLVAFIYRFLKTPKDLRLISQLFVMSLLVVFIFVQVPIRSISQLNINDAVQGEPAVGLSIYNDVVDEALIIVEGIQDALFGSYVALYIWAKSTSLRGPYSTTTLWCPRLFSFILFLLRLSIALGLKTFLPFLPFVGLLAFIQMLRIGGGYQDASSVQILVVTVLTIYEFAILITIFMDFRACRKSLQNSSYLGTRSTRILCYFFQYNVVQFIIVSFVLVAIELFSVPISFQSVLFQVSGILYLNSSLLRMSNLIALVFVFTECITMFPANSRSLPYCWREAEETEDATRMSFSRFEKCSKRGSSLEQMHSRRMILETQLLMMNFCMLSYEYGNPTPPRTFQELGVDPKYKFHEHISDALTDTHLILLDSDDRIVVSFRGTKSTGNVMTDLKAHSTKLAWALSVDEKLDKEIANDNLEALEHAIDMTPEVVQRTLNVIQNYEPELLRSDKRARVHFGFAQAYRSISQRMLFAVIALYQAKKRRIYMTGHSLGGALATLASYHLSTVLKLENPEEIVCVTCGSPRVGNAFFADLYNRTVPNSWRLVVSGDPVPKIPKGRYTHIGILVLLFFDGELMIDPTFIEELNHERGSNTLAFHRMWSYRLVIHRWCELYSSDFDPILWNFGETPADIVKLFGSASYEKARHVELMKLEFLRETMDEYAKDHRAHRRMKKLRQRIVEDDVLSAWKTLIEKVSSEQTV